MGDPAKWDAAGSNPGGPGGAGQQKAPPKQVRRIGAKPPPDRAPRSIYCITLKNPIRKLCLQVRKTFFCFLNFHKSKFIFPQKNYEELFFDPKNFCKHEKKDNLLIIFIFFSPF